MSKPLLERLEIQVFIALILGILAGLYAPIMAEYVGWLGDLFMKLLKVFLAPLLFFSVIIAVLSLGDLKKLGNMGARTIGYYMLTTTLAIGTSLLLMNIFAPGKGVELGMDNMATNIKAEALTFGGFMNSLIPSNIITAFVELNAMQIVMMGIILGICILCIQKKEKTERLKDMFDTLNSGILKFIGFVIVMTPIGVFAILTKVISENGIESVQKLLPFVLVIIFALFIHAVIVLPSVGILIGKFNPYKYFLKVKDAIMVAFSTSSSSATMGISMSLAKENAKLRKEVVDFTFPIGTTINMDGTALYQAGAAIFVAQMMGVDLLLIQQLTIIFIVILASVGAAGIPGAGILILATVFLSIGLPVEAIGIILAVDRILDMFRTSVNVWGDLLTAKVIDRYYVENIEEPDDEN